MRSKKLERIIFCHTFATANKLRWRVKAAAINDNAIFDLLPHQPDSERPSGFILRHGLHGFINKDTAVINEKKAAFL